MLQRTPEWFAVRCGKVTASRINDVLDQLKTGSGEKVTRRNYRRELVLERRWGTPQDSGYISYAMQKGIDNEATARDAYAFDAGIAIEEIGFVQHPTIEHAGASPDGLVGSDGLVELKCPEANNMFEMLTKRPLDAKYRNQVLWQMACMPERQWCDVVFYREGIPVIEKVRVERDNEKIAMLERMVKQFLAEVESEYELLCKGYPR
jgi:hypothetical protein